MAPWQHCPFSDQPVGVFSVTRQNLIDNYGQFF